MREFLFKFNKSYFKFKIKGYAFCIPLFIILSSTLFASNHHTIDFDTTSTYFKSDNDYGTEIKNTVIQVINDVEQLVLPKYNNQIRIKVNAIDKKIPALAYFVPKYENILLLRNGITTGRVWQKYNTTNINPADATYDGEFSINFNYEYNTINSDFDADKYDLYSIILHEYIHSLGFFSMITKNGESLETNYKEGIYSLFDTRLLSDSNRVLKFGSNDLVSFSPDYIPKLKEECAISYLYELPIVFSPSDWLNGSSISHLDTNCLDKEFVMMPTVYKGQLKRTPQYEDLFVLSTLGFTITGVFQGDTILNSVELANLSEYEIPITNNDFIDSLPIVDNNILKIPASILISNDENVKSIKIIENESIKLINKKNYTENDTIVIELGRFKNPYQFNYFCISDEGFISNPALVNINIPIDNNSIGECKKDTRNLICNGDFEQVSTTGQLKLPSELDPVYLYNRNDSFEPCVPSRFLTGWDLSYTPDIYTHHIINDLPISYDPNFSTKIKSDFPFTYGFLSQIKKPTFDKHNNFFLGLYAGFYSIEEFLNIDNLEIETIGQRLIGINENEKYRLELDLNPLLIASEVARFYVMFSKKELCSNNRLNIESKDDYLLLSNRMDFNITRNNKQNHGLVWQHLEFKNLNLTDYKYVYFLANNNNINDLTRNYYFLDNISLRPMGYGLDKRDTTYNYCDIGTIEIPIKIEKEIEESDTLLVKVTNSRLNFGTEGKIIAFGEGKKDTTIYFSATYNSDYRYNPEYIVDIELESNKKGNLGEEDMTLTINNNNLEVDVYADDYCDEDSLFFYLEITQKDFTSIEEGQIFLYLPKSFVNNYEYSIMENTLDPNLQIALTSQTENLESIYKIYLNSTLSKSVVHGVDEDLKLIIRFAVKMNLLDSLNIIKTVTNLFADGCEKTQYDTVYSNALRNRIAFTDTMQCNEYDLSHLESRKLKLISGNDIDDLVISKSGDYVVSYNTVEDCYVQDTFNLTISNDFYLETNTSYKDSNDITIRIESKFVSAIDSIREFTGKNTYKIYPVTEGRTGNGKATSESLSPIVNFYQIADTFFFERVYDIKNEKFDVQNNHYRNIVIYYPKADSIVVESDSKYYDGCEYRNSNTTEIIYLSDSSNRVYDYKLEDRIINLYPNPTDKIINVEFEVYNKGLYTFSIFDFLGRQLYTTTKYIHRGSYKESVDISDYINGTYSFMIVSPVETHFKKFLISK